MINFKKLTKDQALKKIVESKGRFFTATCITRSGHKRTMNAKFTDFDGEKRERDRMLGYVTVYDVIEKKRRKVNAQTLQILNIDHKKYLIK